MLTAGRRLAPRRIRRCASSRPINSKCRCSHSTCRAKVRLRYGPLVGVVVGDAVIDDHGDRDAPPGRGATAVPPPQRLRKVVIDVQEHHSASVHSRLLIQCLTLAPASQRLCRSRAEGRLATARKRCASAAARRGNGPCTARCRGGSPCPIPLLDRPPQDRQGNQPARLVGQRFRLHSGLVGIEDAVSGQLIFGGDGAAVQFQPVELEVAFAQQFGHDLAMKCGEAGRGKTARLPQPPPPALVEIDQQIGRRIQLVQPLDRMEHGPARIEQIALAAADLLAMALGQTRQVRLPGRRQLRRASNSAPGADARGCRARPGGESARPRRGLRR